VNKNVCDLRVIFDIQFGLIVVYKNYPAKEIDEKKRQINQQNMEKS